MAKGKINIFFQRIAENETVARLKAQRVESRRHCFDTQRHHSTDRAFDELGVRQKLSFSLRK